MSALNSSGAPSGARILVVEDSAVNRTLLAAALRRRWPYVDMATNGQEALKALHSKAYDLVVMDCSMPVMTGPEATLTIRNIEAAIQKGDYQPGPGSTFAALPPSGHLPVIAVTAHPDRDHCFNSGMDGFVAKPFRPAELIEAVAKYLPHGGTSEEQCVEEGVAIPT